MSPRPSWPFQSAPHLVAKARGSAGYDVADPRGFSPLDRFANLWRALEYVAREMGVSPWDLMVTSLRALAERDRAGTVPPMRALAVGLTQLARERPSAIADYVDDRLEGAKRDEAVHQLRSDIRKVEHLKTGEPLRGRDLEACASIVTALRNAAFHTGAMSSADTGAAYPDGCVILDKIAMASYARLAGLTLEEAERVVRECAKDLKPPPFAT